MYIYTYINIDHTRQIRNANASSHANRWIHLWCMWYINIYIYIYIYVNFMSVYLHTYFFTYIYIYVYNNIYIYIYTDRYHTVLIMSCMYKHLWQIFFQRSHPWWSPMAGYLWPNYISDFAISVSGTKENHSTAQSLRAPYASKVVCRSPFATICCKSSETICHMT